MPAFWMVTDRNLANDPLGLGQGSQTYWVSDGGAPLEQLANWTQVTGDEFQNKVIAAASQFPLIRDPELHEDQKHVNLFIHGYNNSWQDSVKRYQSICENLFAAHDLGICILYSWPSQGQPQDYFPDRQAAERCAPDLFEVLSVLYTWLVQQQTDCIRGTGTTCRAKTSIIAHSMGNYVLQRAIRQTWTRHNQPLLVSLINQLVMVAADVDNDLFKSGERVEQSDGDALANLSYRITALYTGRDPVLGASAGLKHFGKRRLGRSGLDPNVPVPDNVWEVDCSDFLPAETGSIHSAYFDQPKIIELMRRVLRGVDRNFVLEGLSDPE